MKSHVHLRSACRPLFLPELYHVGQPAALLANFFIDPFGGMDKGERRLPCYSKYQGLWRFVGSVGISCLAWTMDICRAAIGYLEGQGDLVSRFPITEMVTLLIPVL